MEVSLSEAASRLGVSVDTIRRRLKSGELAGRQVGRKTVVSLPEAARRPDRRLDDDLLAEVRAERDRLAGVLASLLKQLELAGAERAELRGLLDQALKRAGERRPQA